MHVHPILATYPAHCRVLYIIIVTILGDLCKSHILFLLLSQIGDVILPSDVTQVIMKILIPRFL
jgi:hypothetical protein